MAASFTATAAAAEIRHGSTSGFQYLAALVERWDSTQKFANALLLKDEGLQTLRRNVAEESAESTRTGKRFAATGALASVPFVIPPFIDARGYSIHGGNAALGAGQATRDAPVLAALFNAGACLFGLSNTAELGQPGLQAHSVHGLVKNPCSTQSVAGSGCAGSAALVAAHVVPFALGVDTSSGDVRVPASLCGVVGFRPSQGRYSSAGLLTLSSTLDTVGLMARTVEDVQLIDAVIAASAGAATRPAPLPAIPSVAAAAASPRADGSVLADVGCSGSSPSSGPSASELAVKRCSDPDEHRSRAAAVAEEAALRVMALSGAPTGAAGVASSAGASAGSAASLVADLRGVRLGVVRNLRCEDAGASAVFEAALARMGEAGAEVVAVPFAWPGVDGAAPAVAGVIDPILGYEAPREIAAYLGSHLAPPPKPVPTLDEEGNEVTPEEPEVDPDDAEAVAAAARAKLPKPLDSVVTVRRVFESFQGQPADKAFLLAQLDPATAVSNAAYQAALTHRRQALQQYLAALFEEAGVAALVYPSTPIPAAPLKATEEPHSNGTVYCRYARLAAAAGLPAVTVPVGITRPSAALRGAPPTERLPVGLELMAPAGQDVPLLALARAVQGLQSLLPDPVVVQRWNDGVSVASA